MASGQTNDAAPAVLACEIRMEQLIPWLTPALMLGLFGWLRSDIRNLRQDVNKRVDDVKTDVRKSIDDLKTDVRKSIDDLKTDVGHRFDDTHKRLDNLNGEMNQRFDQVSRELGENRERMAKLEGSLEGFLAGRRDRDAA